MWFAGTYRAYHNATQWKCMWSQELTDLWNRTDSTESGAGTYDKERIATEDQGEHDSTTHIRNLSNSFETKLC